MRLVHIKTSASLRYYRAKAKKLGKKLKRGKNVLGTTVVYLDRKSEG